ncbi:MAG: hypothetical protein F4Y57_15190 [Acidobacteria bacterium]|nr:hypothetical protein [Acidobacteriota bacterium]
MKKSKVNVKEFDKTERRDVSMSDLEDVFRQVLSHSDKPKTKSENREPSKEELNRKWKLGQARDEQ